MECCTLRGVNIQVWRSFVLAVAPGKSKDNSLVQWEINKIFVFSANALRFKMVCKREANFVEKLVVRGVLKYVAFFVNFVKWVSTTNCGRVTGNSLVLIKNG